MSHYNLQQGVCSMETNSRTNSEETNEIKHTYMAGWKQMTMWDTWHTESRQMTAINLSAVASLAHWAGWTIHSQLHIKLGWMRWRICLVHNHQAVIQKDHNKIKLYSYFLLIQSSWPFHNNHQDKIKPNVQ